MKAYKLEHVKVTYGTGESKVEAIKDISLEISENEIISVIGPSGAGKSTLLNVLSGLERATHGKVTYQGIEMSALNQRKLAKLRLQNFGFVFQGFYLIPTMTVRDNIWLPAIVDKGKVEVGLFEEIISDLNLGNRIKHLPNQLSGGEKQRVAIARALMNKPKVIFADEPTGNLDSKTSREVMDIIKKMAKANKQTIVMVTHDPNLTKYADRIIHILDGKIQEITEIKSETTLDADVSDIKQTDENFKPEVLPAGSSG